MLMLAGLICGFVFGWGLLISGMVQPTKVLAFLDIFGAWDPSLAVVMAAALAVSVPGFRLTDRSARAPRCSESGGGSWACARDRRWKALPRSRRASSSSSRRWRPG